LDAWLEGNGFVGLTQEDDAIVSEYIGEDWCFVAAKLRRDGEGFSRPHPLSMTFACDKPIYPMRLTATAGSDVYLELYVIADRQATCDILTAEVSDVFGSRRVAKSDFTGKTVHPSFSGETFNEDIGHPDASKVMWDGCFLSKLCGSLKPKDMSEDIVLQLTADGPHRQRYYSHHGAGETALALFLGMWCVLPVLLTLVRYLKKKELSSRAIFVKRALAPMVLFSLVAGAVTYTVLPKVDVRTSKAGSHVGMMVSQRTMAVELSILARDHSDFAGMSAEKIAALVHEYFTSKEKANVYTGEPIKKDDSPGDYTIIEDDRGVVWRTYSSKGYPYDSILRTAVED
jgi:hypothetical protein